VNIALSAVAPNGAKSMSLRQKKRVALDAIGGGKTITRIAQENNTSRKFVRRQAQILQTAMDKEFTAVSGAPDDVIYHLPVTKHWIEQLVLSLMLVAHASYRNIMTILKDVLGYNLSLGSIHNIFRRAVDKAKEIQATENLSGIEITANDELFHRNKPILSGIDSRSLYCYLLSVEDRRDEKPGLFTYWMLKTKGYVRTERLATMPAGWCRDTLWCFRTLISSMTTSIFPGH
jgi:hypothetical protein